MAIDRDVLARQVGWVQDHIDTLEKTESLEDFHAAVMRFAGGPGGWLDFNGLAEDDALELTVLCNRVAIDNGLIWGAITE